jgi:hypothetical protein
MDTSLYASAAPVPFLRRTPIRSIRSPLRSAENTTPSPFAIHQRPRRCRLGIRARRRLGTRKLNPKHKPQQALQARCDAIAPMGRSIDRALILVKLLRPDQERGISAFPFIALRLQLGAGELAAQFMLGDGGSASIRVNRSTDPSSCRARGIGKAAPFRTLRAIMA